MSSGVRYSQPCGVTNQATPNAIAMRIGHQMKMLINFTVRYFGRSRAHRSTGGSNGEPAGAGGCTERRGGYRGAPTEGEAERYLEARARTSTMCTNGSLVTCRSAISHVRDVEA